MKSAEDNVRSVYSSPDPRLSDAPSYSSEFGINKSHNPAVNKHLSKKYM